MYDLPFAEDINYWKTGRSSPDEWIEKACRQIKNLGGDIISEAFGRDSNGIAAYMIKFIINGHKFKLIWPVLPTRSGNVKAARIQAATMLYHDVKAKCISATVLGPKVAFFPYLLLPDGRTVSEATLPEVMESIPRLLKAPGNNN